MYETATREILWNVHSISNVVAMYALLVLSSIIAAVGTYRHAELWMSGKENTQPLASFFDRVSSLLVWGGLQRGVAKRRDGGIAHILVYIGFLVLLFTTTMVLLEHDFGLPIYRGHFYLLLTFLSDTLGLGLLIGCLLFMHRRYVRNADLVHNRFADSSALLLLSLLIIQGFLLEGLRIHATNDEWRYFSPVGYLVSELFWSLSESATSYIHFALWWFHTITVFTVIALVPYSKFFHIIVSCVNLYLRDPNRVKGALQSPGDLMARLEAGEEFNLGIGTSKDYSWKQLIELDACTSCGRCQDACPAYNTGKPLSPKWLILDTRNHLLALHEKELTTKSKLSSTLRSIDSSLQRNVFFPSHGVDISLNDEFTYQEGGAFKGKNKAVHTSVKAMGVSSEQKISGDVLDPNLFWSCTTCYACVAACPVGINHVDQIIENRRNMTLMRGEIPHEAQATMKALENRANPYGDPADRINWLGDLNVRILKPGDSVDYLYWVGCVSAYDPRKQKIAQSLVKLMQKAGLNFGILGTAEGCTGDPARRLGEENLFQTLAKNNIELLKSLTFKVLVANCPHCFNTIKNEYPQFGNLSDNQKPEIIHHSVLLKRLVSEGKLEPTGSAKDITFHDPCYLGRYNNEYEAPRDTLKSIKSLNIIEMDKSREEGMCCGAGGGHFWMDLKLGTRVNALRADQAAATGASTVATACPFCLQMMEDGAKLTNREESLTVKDIAEILAESIN